MSSTTLTESAKPEAKKRSRFRTLLVRAAFVSAVGATLIAGWYAVERARSRASWERYAAEARAAGVKLDFAEYLPAPVPDAENFAAIPIFQDAFRATEAGQGAPRPFELPQEGGLKRPPMANVTTGQNIDLAAWQSYFVSAKMIPAAGTNPARDVLTALQKFDPALAQLREAAQRPSCRFPVKWEDGIYATVPHLGALQTSTQIFALRLAAHLALGESAAASEDLRDSMRIYAVTAQEPALITTLVRKSIPVALDQAVWDGLSRRHWQDADLVQIERALRSVNTLADYQFGMGSERAMTNWLYPQLRGMSAAKISEILKIMVSINAQRAGEGWSGRIFALYPQGWMYRNQERSNRFFDELAARVSVDPPRLFLDRPEESGPEKIEGWLDRARLFFFAQAVPTFQTLDVNFASAQALTDQARLGCALERFRLARGAFPQQLEELVPEFLPSLPADVMNGEPYRYRPNPDGGYVLYSVASNLKDDGGQAGSDRNAAKQLDWVWTMPAGTAGAQ